MLHGTLIQLRPATPADKDTLFAWATQSDAAPYWYGDMYNEPLPTREEFFDDWKDYYFDGSQPLMGQCFIIELNGEGVGMVCYNPIDPVGLSTEMDIIIAAKEHKSKGYGSEALKLLMEYLAKTFGVKEFEIHAHHQNARAIRSYEKAGFIKIKNYTENDVQWVEMRRETGE